MSKPLPSRPSLEQLRKQAKDLRTSHQAGEPDALRRIQAHHPDRARSTESQIRSAPFPLSDAQLVIAREYGFPSWPKLKEHIDALSLESDDPMELFKKAFTDHDADLFARLLDRYPEMKARINDPVAPFDSPVITCARTREMLDVLLNAGADINAKSRWWAGGFGLLHGADPDLAAYAIERGAVVDVHAAARLGMIDRLRQHIEAEPRLVHARGGDGQTPLHFASTVGIARFLLDHGAEMDAIDIDHESTPAQYMVRDRQEVLRYLVERGCGTDLLMAAALGDAGRVRNHLDADPACIRMNVSERWFPRRNPRSGGTIYIWTLGQNKTAHAIAREFGHEEVFRLLIDRSPDGLRLALACELGDQALFNDFLAGRQSQIETLSDDERRQLPHAAQRNDTATVRFMLSAGWPVDARGQHGGTALHWAAFHGNTEMAAAILRFQPPLEWTDFDFHATPVGWATHGSEHGWYCRTGDYPGVVETLIQAGAKLPGTLKGTEPVKEVLRRFGVKVE
jgi:hypothetical protein